MKYILLILISIGMVSCHEEVPELKALSGNAFGTTYTIQYFSETSLDAAKGVDSVIYSVNKSVSTYIPNSDISKINRGDTTVVVDAIFKEVYRVSELVHNNSKGFFDPTVGVLRNAYGFGEEEPLQYIDSLTLDSLRRYVGFKKVKITSEGVVQKKYPEIYFDFNAVAKGYGIDLIGRYLEDHGVEHYLIELGGELLAKGINLSKDKPWVAGVESIDSELGNRTISALVTLQDKAMAASGNYRKFRIDETTGKKYVHTINPHTGKAQESNVTSATVIAPTCVLADAYATAFMAMGFNNAESLADYLKDIEVYLTYIDEDNNPQVFLTEGFQKLLLP
ncbi:MAG: FAD:protein FMN transferase [Bacteroidota bacterium]